MPGAAYSRLEPLLAGGEVHVVHGIGRGLRFPAQALIPRHSQARLLLYGALELPVQEALRRTLPAGGVLYDVGANLGFFTLLGARIAGEAGRVIAFEPVAANAALVADAARRNGMGARVEVREAAISAQPGRAPFLVVDDSGWSHLAARGQHPRTVAEVEVDVVTLDGLVDAGAPPPDVIKLDVEGSEIDVLRGGERLLRDHRPVLICELHATNTEICDLLDDADYRIENIDGPEPVRTAGPVHIVARAG
jgi:FkbM family methyltransferase